jgi:hypothetical protein
MNIPSQKTAGWITVLAGLLFIFLSIYYSWLFFTAKADFPPVFKPEQKNAPTETAPLTPSETMDPAAIQALTQQAMTQAVLNTIPTDAVAKLLNLASWSMFSFFLVLAGSYISGIGIKLLTVKEN